ncbi:MAG TPA: DUF3089 domain-containing protein [Polyangiaceae bacterium]|nr:DUF3089 domain-containing protein [Polyangiaceae bacterium]
MKRALLLISTFAIAACSNDNGTKSSNDGGGPDGTTTSSGGSGGSGGTGGSTAKGGSGGSVSTATPDGGGFHVDRSGLKDTGTSGTLDYSNRNLWACLPGNDPNECLTNLDATEILKDNTQQVDKHQVAADPGYDCFYVYPTVALGGNGNMTDFSDISLVLDPLVAQAARFNQLCQIYAPLYRQVSLAIPSASSSDGGAAAQVDGGSAKDGGATKDGGAADSGAATDAGSKASIGVTGDSALAYGDVKAAFQYYMAHYNNGRKFVIMGHSQGTAMLTQLMTELFDNDASLRKQLISALLIGGSIQVPENKDVGGTFQNIPICTKPAQVGCVIAYNSFAQVAPPPANTLFGRGTGPGLMNACTNPSVLAGNSGNYKGGYVPVHFYDPIFAPDAPATPAPMVSTPFWMERDLFSGSCKYENGLSYLEISPNQTSDDKRPVPAYRNTSSEGLGFGMHIFDYAIEMDDLINAVDQQAKAAM